MKNEKKKIFSAREQFFPSSYLYRYTAHDEKHQFQKFWTWDFENGAKMTSATSLDDLYKEDSSILGLFLRYWQIHGISN